MFQAAVDTTYIYKNVKENEKLKSVYRRTEIVIPSAKWNGACRLPFTSHTEVQSALLGGGNGHFLLQVCGQPVVKKQKTISFYFDAI